MARAEAGEVTASGRELLGTAALTARASVRERSADERSGPFLPEFGSRLMQSALRLPLLGKLLGANLLIAGAGLLVHALGMEASQPLVIEATLLASFAVNTLLVRLALRPVDELTRVAHAIANGDRDARAEVLATSDRRIAGLAEAVNLLLDRAAMDEAQIKRLTRASLHARERERASLARELRESTAQHLYALTLQLSAATELNASSSVAVSLESARSMAADVTRAVGLLADSVYPGAVGEHATCAAIQGLANRLSRRTGLRVESNVRDCTGPIPYRLQVALYCFAEEALHNVDRHAGAGMVRMTATRADGMLELRIMDDGMGFDPRSDSARDGVGLFRARELLAHAGGELRVESSPGTGTTVIARGPLEAQDAG
jgi:signal transduction histidine kinase